MVDANDLMPRIPDPRVHFPTIVERQEVPGGKTTWAVICRECSEDAQDYVRCNQMGQYPAELVAMEPKAETTEIRVHHQMWLEGERMADTWRNCNGWMVGENESLSITRDGEVMVTYNSREWRSVIDGAVDSPSDD